MGTHELQANLVEEISVEPDASVTGIYKLTILIISHYKVLIKFKK